MSRRKSRSAFEDLVDLVAMLPWWVGVGLAVVAYVAFSLLANGSPATQPGIGSTGDVRRVLHSSMAGVAQYLVPIVCLLGAATSAWRRSRRARLLDNTTKSEATGALDGMSWREFEMLVGEAFRLEGFHVAETGSGGADGGVDLVLTRNRESFLVQCKQWKAFKVGVDVVRELYGVMAARGVAGGFVVTSGRFTDAAKSFADGRNVKLVDGTRLTAMLERARSAKSKPDDSRAPVRPMSVAAETPMCPSCASKMVRRTATRGRNAGSAFWGCATYPACKGTRH